MIKYTFCKKQIKCLALQTEYNRHTNEIPGTTFIITIVLF